MDPRDDGRERSSTETREYTERLLAKQTAWWKRALHVQAPYRWNLRRLDLGFTLDVGCGIGRNLAHLGGGVGVDHNADSVAVVRARGFDGYTPEEFRASPWSNGRQFDSLLFAHVLEHMGREAGFALIDAYLPYLKHGGKVCVITPQERGYRSDRTHEFFVDFAAIQDAFAQNGLTPVRQFSFPFPRWAGEAFVYNEFVAVATAP
jgi:SAM-dependent methyltransferase